MLERISPRVLVLDPPEKLVLETRASGGYQQFDWTKSVNPFTLTPGQPFTITLQEFPNFFEIFVRDNTTANDLGVYEVDLVLDGGSQVPEVQFAVTPYSKYMYDTLCVLFEPRFLFTGSSSRIHVHKLIHTFHTVRIKITLLFPTCACIKELSNQFCPSVSLSICQFSEKC